MLIDKLFYRLNVLLSRVFKPVMIWGYKRRDGVYLPRTRIGNMTHIEGAKNLDIADNVFVGHFNFIDASNGLVICAGCQITNYVSILTHSSHNSIRLYGDFYTSSANPVGYVKGAVSIGEFTFVGPHSVIMPGANIGRGSIVAAYSFVKGDFTDFAIIAGNPAKVVGDTRDKDGKYLEAHPELRRYYEQWTKSGGV